nr:hypothetical protein [Tanacetum cinerariifolium]
MKMVDDNNSGIQIVENMKGLSVVSEIANQYGNGNVETAPAKGNGNGINGNPIRCYSCRGEEIERVKVNCTLEDTLQQASTSGTQFDNAPVYDSDGSTEVSEQKGISKGTRTNTKFTKQSILGKPPSSSFKPKLFSVTPFPKSSVLFKVDKTNALSKPVTLNSAPFTRESKVVQTVNVIAPRIFKTNPFKTSRVDNVVPNKPIKTSVRIEPISISQPHVITMNDVNSQTNGFSPKDIKSTTRTRRPQPRNNPKNDKVWKPKNVGSKERLASPKPSTPRSCLRWSPTGRLFDLKGKITASSESESQSKYSKGDNACTPNPQEPISRRFPNSTFNMTGGQSWFDTLLIPLLFEYKPKNKEIHGDNECDT